MSWKKIKQNKQKIGVIFLHVKLQGFQDEKVSNTCGVFRPTYKLTELKDSEGKQARKRLCEGANLIIVQYPRGYPNPCQTPLNFFKKTKISPSLFSPLTSFWGHWLSAHKVCIPFTTMCMSSPQSCSNTGFSAHAVASRLRRHHFNLLSALYLGWARKDMGTFILKAGNMTLGQAGTQSHTLISYLGESSR